MTINKLDDIFRNDGCALDECQSINEFKEIYSIALKLATKENRIHELLQWKLEQVTGFGGSYNCDFTDFINVITILDNNRKHNEKREQYISSSLIFPKLEYRYNRMEDVAKQLKLPEEYVNLIYCVLDKNDCMEYGVNLQCAWLTNLGIEMINPELGEEFLKLEEKKYYVK